jgi:uncharacterized protein YbjT (DUF2867 family)
MTSFKGKNPMLNGTGGTDSGFARLNKDSAIVLAQTFRDSIADDSDKKPFIYISAANWNVLADKEYIESKREAEAALGAIPQLRAVFMRPGFMYDATDHRPTARNAIGAVFRMGSKVARLSGIEELIPPAVSVQTVAHAIVEALEDPLLEGVVELKALQKFETMAGASV